MDKVLLVALLAALFWWSVRSVNKTGREIRAPGDDFERAGFERQRHRTGNFQLLHHAQWPYKWALPHRDPDRAASTAAAERRSWWVLIAVAGLCLSVPVVAIILAVLM